MHMMSTFVNYYFRENLSRHGLTPPTENYSYRQMGIQRKFRFYVNMYTIQDVVSILMREQGKMGDETGVPAIRAYLSALAVERRVTASIGQVVCNTVERLLSSSQRVLSVPGLSASTPFSRKPSVIEVGDWQKDSA